MPRTRHPRLKRCTAKAKGTGRRCRRWAVTDRTTCHVHGGGSPKREKAGKRKRPGRLVTHGIYSETQKAEFRDVMGTLEALRETVGLESLETEILCLKYRLIEMLKATNDPCDQTLVRTKPDGSIEDIAGALCERIGRLVTRWHNIVSRDEFVMSVAQLEPVVRAFDKVLDEFVPDIDLERARQSLSDRLRGILLPPVG